MIVRQSDAASAGLELYEQQKFPEAYEHFEKTLQENPGARQSDRIQFDAGAAAYKMKDYNKALQSFSQALLSKNPHLQSESHYNLGNTLYERGEAEKSDEKKLSNWEGALPHYEETLKAEPQNKNAKDNYEYVKKKIEELKKKQEQKPSPTPSPSPSPSPQKDQKKDQKQDDKNQQQQKNDQKDQQQQSQSQNGEGEGNGQKSEKKRGNRRLRHRHTHCPTPEPTPASTTARARLPLTKNSRKARANHPLLRRRPGSSPRVHRHLEMKELRPQLQAPGARAETKTASSPARARRARLTNR